MPSTSDMVQTRVTNLQTFTETQINNANAFFTGLKDHLNIRPVYTSYKDVYFNGTTPVIDATKPDSLLPDLEAAISDADVSNIAGTFTGNQIPDIKDFNMPSMGASSPNITSPNKPSPINAQIPQEPIISNITKPTKPTYTAPTSPILSDITLPTAPVLTIPTFNGTLPTLPASATLPDTFTWSEALYTGPIYNALLTRINNDLTTGGIGVEQNVQDQLMSQKATREALLLTAGMEKAISMWAARGFSLPSGVINQQVISLTKDFDFHLLDNSVTIYVEQLKLAQQNTQFALTTGTVFEQMYVTYHGAVMERALRTAIATVEMGVALYNAQVAAFNVQTDLYKAQAAVFESLIKAELTKTELYKSQMEGAKIEGELNLQEVQIYESKIKATMAVIELYKTEMEGAKIESEIERAKLDIFSAQVQAYMAQVQAKNAEWEGYKAEWTGEISKITGFEAEVKAFVAEANAKTAAAQIEIEHMKTLLEVNKGKIMEYTAEVEGRKAGSMLAIEKIKALAIVYGGQAQMYSAEVDKSAKDGLLQVEVSKVAQLNAEANARLALQSAITNLTSFVNISQIEVEAAKSGASVYASMVASALQAVHAGMTISSGFSYADQKSESKSQSVTFGYTSETADRPSAKQTPDMSFTL